MIVIPRLGGGGSQRLAKFDAVDSGESEALLCTPNLYSVVDEAVERRYLGHHLPEALVKFGSVAHAEREGAALGRRGSVGGGCGHGSKEIARVAGTAVNLDEGFSLRLVNAVVVVGDFAVDVVGGAARGRSAFNAKKRSSTAELTTWRRACDGTSSPSGVTQ